LFPDPEQIIPLVLDLPKPEITGNQATPPITTPEATPAPEFRIGDVIPLRTGVIFDYNGNPVPDGTPVNFIFTMGGETSSVRQVETTRDGLAHTTYTVSLPGTIEILAESENARSEILRIDIPPPSGDAATITPSETPTETPARTSTATAEIVEAETPTTPAPPDQPGFSDWLIAIFVSGAIASIVYRLSSLVGQVRWGVRAGFLSLIGGLLAYSYLVLKMPGSERFLENSVSLSVLLGTFIGTVLGLLIAFSWRTIVAVGQRISSTN
jgi:beta-N-acetylhexosaminidase